jgi:hypothetical protein
MRPPDKSRLLDLLAVLSGHSNFSVAAFAGDESRCHRSVLRALLEERNADRVTRGADDRRRVAPAIEVLR